MQRAAGSPADFPPARPPGSSRSTLPPNCSSPEWVRRLTKDGWITKTERGRYRVVDVVRGSANPRRGERNALLSSRV